MDPVARDNSKLVTIVNRNEWVESKYASLWVKGLNKFGFMEIYQELLSLEVKPGYGWMKLFKFMHGDKFPKYRTEEFALKMIELWKDKTHLKEFRDVVCKAISNGAGFPNGIIPHDLAQHMIADEGIAEAGSTWPRVEEQRLIQIIQQQSAEKFIGAPKLWQKIEASNLFYRKSARSIQEYFLNNILPKIELYVTKNPQSLQNFIIARQTLRNMRKVEISVSKYDAKGMKDEKEPQAGTSQAIAKPSKRDSGMLNEDESGPTVEKEKGEVEVVYEKKARKRSKKNEDDGICTIAKTPFSEEERTLVARGIINSPNTNFTLGGNRFWQLLEEEKKLGGRSWQSARQHFRMDMKSGIENLVLTDEEKEKLRERIKLDGKKKLDKNSRSAYVLAPEDDSRNTQSSEDLNGSDMEESTAGSEAVDEREDNSVQNVTIDVADVGKSEIVLIPATHDGEPIADCMDVNQTVKEDGEVISNVQENVPEDCESEVDVSEGDKAKADVSEDHQEENGGIHPSGMDTIVEDDSQTDEKRNFIVEASVWISQFLSEEDNQMVEIAECFFSNVVQARRHLLLLQKNKDNK